MNKAYVLMILGVAALPVGGCGDSHSTAGVDSFIRTMAQQSCDWEFRCCKDAEIQSLDGNKFTTQDRCVDYRELALEDQLYLDRLAVKQGRLRIDGTRQAACLAQLAAKQCNPDPNHPNPMPTDPMAMDACANVFVGATPVGAECVYADECVEGAHCVSDQVAVGRGVCVPFQKVGEICNQSSDCDPTIPQIYCSQKDFTCRVRGRQGEVCGYTIENGVATLPLLLECDTTGGDLYCDPVTNTCQPLPQANQPCLSAPPPGVSSECDPNPALNLVCDFTVGLCRAPGQVGDDCSSFACDDTLYCDSGTQRCAQLPTLGQDCEVSSFHCAKPYFCNFNKSPAVCDQPAQLGQDCSQVTCDTALYCDRTGVNPVCKPQLADGLLCTSSEQCLSFDCGGSPLTCQPRTTGIQCIGR